MEANRLTESTPYSGSNRSQHGDGKLHIIMQGFSWLMTNQTKAITDKFLSTPFSLFSFSFVPIKTHQFGGRFLVKKKMLGCVCHG